MLKVFYYWYLLKQLEHDSGTFFYLIDNDGDFLIDNDGDFLIEEY